MNQLSLRDLDTHVRVVGWLLIVAHALFLVLAVFLFVLLVGIGAVSGDRQAFTILGLIGTFIGGLLVILGIPGMAAGVGLLRRAAWGRILGIVVATLGLFNFPIGTIIGIYVLWVLLQNSTGDYFAARA